MILSFMSGKQSETGMANGLLKPCPDTPNCVCSEYQESPRHIEPISFAGDSQSAFKRIKTAVLGINGKIEDEHNGYLHAVFTTPVFRFKDDLEIRIDGKNQLVHFRSASRVGHSDLGTNRKRVESLRSAFERMKNP
jgi:uncharacterized protein (DUF1499 family)